MTEIIKSILLPVLILAAILLIAFAVCKIWKRIRIANALNAPHDKHYLHNLLAVTCGSDSVKYNIRLPRKLYTSSESALLIDCMIISRGGITILEILPVKGALDNPYVGAWGVKTADGVQTFPNPFEVGSAHIEALRKLLATAGIFNAAIQVVPLLPNDQIVLHYHNEKILTPAKLIPYIKDQNRNRFLGRTEQKKAIALLDRFTEQSARKRMHSHSNHT